MARLQHAGGRTGDEYCARYRGVQEIPGTANEVGDGGDGGPASRSGPSPPLAQQRRLHHKAQGHGESQQQVQLLSARDTLRCNACS